MKIQRTEEFSFRLDVYLALIRFTHHRVSGFLNGIRKRYGDDHQFFSTLLDSSDEILSEAYRQGKMTAISTEPFINQYKRVICNDGAYLAFIYEEKINSLIPVLFETISHNDTRTRNAFNSYWRDKCSRVIKKLYYRTLIIDPTAPKFDSIGFQASRALFEDFLSFKGKVDELLSSLSGFDISIIKNNNEQYLNSSTEIIEDTKEENDSDTSPIIHTPFIEEDSIGAEMPIIEANDYDIPFLDYVYDHVVALEYPTAAITLNNHYKSISKLVFYNTILKMDNADALKELYVSDMSRKTAIRLCDMMRRIVSNSGAKKCFEERRKVQLFAPFINNKMSAQDLRTFHAFKNYFHTCNDSVLIFYLKVVGLDSNNVKFSGLSTPKSKELYQIFTELLSEVDIFISESYTSSGLLNKPELQKLKLDNNQLRRITETYERCGHYPLFTTISIFFDQLENRYKDIAIRALNLFNNHPLEDLSIICLSLSLSRERVRQLRDESLRMVMNFPVKIYQTGILDDYKYDCLSDYDFDYIREQEGVDFSNQYITACIAAANPTLELIGDNKNALTKPANHFNRLYIVPRTVSKYFDFKQFIDSIDSMLREKRYTPYREDLESYLKRVISRHLTDTKFYEIVKECRLIMSKGYPDNIINSQIYIPANARKTIPCIIEDILRDFNHPMTAEEICEQLNNLYPELKQIPSKIGPNALRNNNIVAVSRSSTYALREWDDTEKRGGTIRDMAEEYLNSLITPIATLSNICEYISQFREDVKEGSVKANLLAESGNRYSLFYKGSEVYIGFTDYAFGDEYKRQEKRHGRRSFETSISVLEKFINDNGRFPFSAGDEEEVRLIRFFNISKIKQSKGELTDEESKEIDRIENTYGHLKFKKERVGWEERFERFVKYITDNDKLPCPSSPEYKWFIENKSLYEKNDLDLNRMSSFSMLVKIVDRME